MKTSSENTEYTCVKLNVQMIFSDDNIWSIYCSYLVRLWICLKTIVIMN